MAVSGQRDHPQLCDQGPEDMAQAQRGHDYGHAEHRRPPEIGMLGLVSTSCPTKIFLANPDMDRELYADAFHLNDTEIELIAGLIPPGEMVIRRARSSKKVRLEVDSVSYWMATNNAKDNVKKYEYFNRFGIAQGIKQLAIDHPFRPHGVVAMPAPKPATQPVHAS